MTSLTLSIFSQATAFILRLPTGLLWMKNAFTFVTVFSCLALTWLASFFLVHVFVALGGMIKIFACTLILGIYSVVLLIAYHLGRPETHTA